MPSLEEESYEESQRRHVLGTPIAPSFRLTDEERQKRYKGWDGGVYRVISRHACGYHVHCEKSDRFACISERALGGTYREIL